MEIYKLHSQKLTQSACNFLQLKSVPLVSFNLGRMLIIRRDKRKGIQQKKEKKDDVMQGSMATTTPLVKMVFDLMFKDQIDEQDDKAGRNSCA